VAFKFQYAYSGPPFNFLGTFTASQKQALETWVKGRLDNFAGIEVFYRIRAQQLRKTAGLLETYYLNDDPDALKPTFQKPAWQPGPQGHWVPGPRIDHIPMVYVSQIKGYMQPQFEHDDDAVFFMNHLRTIIERNEDEAQFAVDALSTANPFSIPVSIAKIESLFTQPEYQAVLVDDVNTANMYRGAKKDKPPQPYFRVNPLDPPTVWELEQHSKSTDGNIQLKFPTVQSGQ
jgi:hypothetical protein